MADTIHYHERQALWSTESIDNGILQLELFKPRAKIAIPVLRQMVRDLADGDGLAPRDQFRSNFFERLVEHLREVHGID